MGNGTHYVKTTSILPDGKDLPQNTSPPYHRLLTARANNYALKASCWTSPETSPRRSDIAPLIIMSFFEHLRIYEQQICRHILKKYSDDLDIFYRDPTESHAKKKENNFWPSGICGWPCIPPERLVHVL